MHDTSCMTHKAWHIKHDTLSITHQTWRIKQYTSSMHIKYDTSTNNHHNHHDHHDNHDEYRPSQPSWPCWPCCGNYSNLLRIYQWWHKKRRQKKSSWYVITQKCMSYRDTAYQKQNEANKFCICYHENLGIIMIYWYHQNAKIMGQSIALHIVIALSTLSLLISVLQVLYSVDCCASNIVILIVVALSWSWRY